MTATFPAPWRLQGRAAMFVYRFPRAFVERHGLLQPDTGARFAGGFGALMLVDYTQSDCGPYRELLYIPGSFEVDGVARPSISKIYVSTEVSVVNGQRNWGIPKAVAQFDVAGDAEGEETWAVRRNGEDIFRATVARAGVVRFPVSSALVPNVLVQWWQQATYLTRLEASGWGRRARLRSVWGNGVDFPDLSTQRVFAGLGVQLTSFQMTFHPATVTPAAAGEARPVDRGVD